jgi:sulfide:quinone oxidoreductase
VKPGVRFVRQTITSIDPERRRVTTDGGVFDADYLVVALGADLDVSATPGLAEHGNEFYSVAGATRLRDVLPDFTRGHAIVGACGARYKCHPAPSEAALLLDEYLTMRGVRAQCDITLVLPFPAPVPPSPESSAAQVKAFAARNITYVPNRRVVALEATEALAAQLCSTTAQRCPDSLPRYSETLRAGRGRGERAGGERLDPGQSAHARDEVQRRLRDR